MEIAVYDCSQYPFMEVAMRGQRVLDDGGLIERTEWFTDEVDSARETLEDVLQRTASDSRSAKTDARDTARRQAGRGEDAPDSDAEIGRTPAVARPSIGATVFAAAEAEATQAPKREGVKARAAKKANAKKAAAPRRNARTKSTKSDN